jgi:hypothetical protein
MCVRWCGFLGCARICMMMLVVTRSKGGGIFFPGAVCAKYIDPRCSGPQRVLLLAAAAAARTQSPDPASPAHLVARRVIGEGRRARGRAPLSPKLLSRERAPWVYQAPDGGYARHSRLPKHRRIKKIKGGPMTPLADHPGDTPEAPTPPRAPVSCWQVLGGGAPKGGQNAPCHLLHGEEGALPQVRRQRGG